MESNVHNHEAVNAALKARMGKSRQELQADALVIESLLEAAIALFGTGRHQDMIAVVEMANERAAALNSDLDIVNGPEAVQ